MQFIVEGDRVSRAQSRMKLKLKGRQLRDMQDGIAVVNYALEKALHDHFLRQEIFELLESALEEGAQIERTLAP